MCVLVAGHHLWWSGCNFGVLSGASSCLSLTFLHLLMCFSARMTTKFVSHNFRFGSGLYAEAGILGGVYVCGCVGRGLDVVPCWWSLYMCVGFFLWRRSCVFILSSCWGWGRLLLSLFWCDCSALLPGAPAVFRRVSCSWLPFSVITFSNNRTRSNGWKLEPKRFNTSQCGNFFTYKIATIWNRLPTEAVNSASVEQFKIELDKVIDTLT